MCYLGQCYFLMDAVMLNFPGLHGLKITSNLSILLPKSVAVYCSVCVILFRNSVKTDMCNYWSLNII